MMSKPQKAYKYTNEELQLIFRALACYAKIEPESTLVGEKVQQELIRRDVLARSRAKHPRSPLEPAKVELAKKLLADTRERLTLREVAKQTGISYGRVWLISKGKLG